ncbi:hypothetical protein [Amycolatopsis sp. CA-230715]|uniref:hypothetical protein n=1 Tax=Amycolatopsis sp. CA-230715 TaxID=2745196 RepID=UPI001C00C55C|nr:hypothetical protein [Amycolatopsis sp. CA-230715]QWF76660.1 hypothetical protein HUW46_00036 [Amycolatopsis sp. CA-230715]
MSKVDKDRMGWAACTVPPVGRGEHALRVHGPITATPKATPTCMRVWMAPEAEPASRSRTSWSAAPTSGLTPRPFCGRSGNRKNSPLSPATKSSAITLPALLRAFAEVAAAEDGRVPVRAP